MADYSEIPQGAIDLLLENPSTADGFNAAFGAGQAEGILAANSDIPPEAEPEEDWSYLGETWRAVAGGSRDAVQETGNFIDSAGEWTTSMILGEGNDLFYGDNGFEVIPIEEALQRDDISNLQKGMAETPLIGDDGLLSLPEVEDNRTIGGGIGRGIVQFTVGMAGAGKVTRMNGLRGAFVNGAIADAVAFNPEDPNVMAILGEYDIDTGALGEVLATDPDDPEYINRLRNVAEGALAGVIVEALGYGVRAARAARRGDDAAAQAAGEAQAALLKELDAASEEAAAAVRADAEETLNVSRTLLDPLETPVRPETPDVTDGVDAAAREAAPDGQLALDLGDTPAPAPRRSPEADVEPRRIFLSPPKLGEISLQARLASGVDIQTKGRGLSFRSLNTVTDFEEVIDEMAGAVAGLAREFSEIKGGDVQRWATVKAQTAAKLREMARMTNEDPETVIKRFMSGDMGDITQIAAEVHARSRYLMTIETELKEMADAIANGKFDPVRFRGIKDMDHLRLAFNQRREVAANLLAGQDALRSNVARAMNAMKMAVEGDAGIQKMLRDPAMFRDIDAAARAVDDAAKRGSEVPSVRVIDEALSKLHGYMDKINSFRINSLLSGVGTQEVNLVSNLANALLIPTEQLLGGAVKFDLRLIQHALRQFQGTFLGARDSVATALKAGWWDEAVLDPFSAKIEDDAFRKGITNVKPVDNVITMPSRALMTMDEFFKQSQYRGVVFADANAEATAKGLKGEERTAFIKDYIRSSYSDTGAALRSDALLQARRSTFTEPLEAGLASMIQQAAIKHPLIRFFVPFVRTPINILSQTFQHAPVLGMASKRFRADLQAGGARAAQARGKQMVGAGLVTTAGFMAAAGNITGSGPTDPRIRAVWLKNNQPYSFRVIQEDGSVTWISYARMEPLSNVFAIAADAVEIMGDKYGEADSRNVIAALNMAVMENTVNKTFTQGIYDAMSLFVGRPHEQERAINNFVASFVPNILNQTNGDEALREARTITDAIKARTGLYNEVDPRRNMLGEVVVRTLPKYDPLGLTEEDNREIDTVLQEITRVAMINDTVSGNPARKIGGPNGIDLSETPYSENQSIYDRWLELTGTVEINGRTLREELEQVMDSPSYQNAPDGFRGASSGTKGTIIQRVISRYREAAKGELPELRELIQSERRLGANMLREQVGTTRPQFLAPNLNPTNTQRRSFEELLNR